MANSIWDVVYGEDRFKGLLGQEGVQATGGGTVYDPTTDYKETRYDNQGNSYLSNPDAPLIPGHTRAGDTPMFESTKVELPPVQSPHDYGSNYYSDEPWTPKVTRPNVQSATIDSLLAQQGVNQVTQQEQDQFNRINASQNRETRYDDQGNPYQVRRDLPLIPGHTRSLEPQSVEPKVDPMSLYNRQGRADYTPQNIVSDEVVEGSPSLGYYPNEAERAYQEEAWYQEQDKIEAQIQELLKGTALEQQRLEAEDDKLLQQFQQDDFNQRVQDRLSQPTPDWLGQSQGALTDAQREDLNRYTDTDSFGNPLDTDAFGNTNYETNLNRQLDKLNRPFYDEFYGADTQEQVPTPQQASNTTDFFRDRAQASKQYQDAILNIGDTIGEGVSSLYEGAKDLGSNIDLGGVGESISNIWGDVTKPDTRSQSERWSDAEKNIAQPLREGIKNLPNTVSDLYQDYFVPADKVVTQEMIDAYNKLKGGYDVVSKGTSDVVRAIPSAYSRGVGGMVKAGKTLGNVVMGEEYFDETDGEIHTPSKPDYNYPIVGEGAEIIGAYGGGMGAGVKLASKAPHLVKYLSSILGGTSTLDPTEGNLSAMIQDTDYRNALTEYLASSPDQEASSLEKLKFYGKTFMEDTLIGLPFDGAILGYQAIKNNPDLKAKILEELSTWGEPLEKTTDSLLEMSTMGTVKDGGRKEMVGGDYKGTHTAPQPEGKNSLDDFSEIFPDNANDPNFARYYGMGGEYAKADAETIAVMKAVQGNPDAEVTIYRAVPKGTKDINAGDWVSTSKDYTKKHGERYIDGDYDIIEKKVRAGDLHTDGDLHEWGYNPSRTDDGVLGQVDTPIDPKTRLELNKQKAESKKRAERLKKQQEIGKAQSKVDEAGFFSRAEQSILDLKQDKNKPNDVLRYLNKQGVTKNEIEDVGLLDYLEKAQETNESVTKKGLLDIVQKNKPRQSEIVLKGGSEDVFESIDPDYDYWDIEKGAFQDNFVDMRVDSFDYELTSDPSGFDYYDELLDGLSDLNPKKYPQENSRTTWGKKLFDDLDNEKGLDPILERDIDVVLRNIAKEEYLDAPYRKTEIDIGGEKINLYYNEGEGTFYARHEDLPDWEDELIAKDKEITSLSEAVVKLRERFGDYSIGETMHSAHVQPGADLSTYEEVYITSDMVRKHGGFSHEGHHGDIEDVILHMRTSVRTDNEGKKVLFIEELQSDLHQKGRQKGVGYRDSDYKTQLLKNKIAKGDLDDEYDILVKEMDEAGYRVSTTSDGTYLTKKDGNHIATSTTVAKIDSGLTNPTPQYLVDPTTLPESEFKKLDSWFGKYKEFNKRFKDNVSERDAILNKVPKAPFRDDAWIQAGLEKAIQMAKSKGVDRVAWTTPEQQVAVWSDKYEKLYQTVYGDKLPGVAKRIANKYGTNTGKTEIEFYGDESFVPNNTTNVDYIDINHTLGEGDYGKGIPLSAVGVGAPTGGLLSMGESEETQADETEGLLKLNKTADKPMKGVLDGVKGLPKEIMEIRSVRNNNPGNIKLNSANDWDGQTNTGSKDTFAHFKTPEHGVRALVKVINANLRATNSYEAFVNRYASEPNERAYYKKHGKLKPHLQNYAKILSKSQGAKDIKSNPKNVDMLKWIKAIIKAEGGQETLQYFTDDIIRKGMKMATKSK